jgi:pantothenate kinase type III
VGSGEVLAVEGDAAYLTLGVDRPLALRGAAALHAWPVMAIDCGSAMTYK